jgi:hypothetical protein
MGEGPTPMVAARPTDARTIVCVDGICRLMSFGKDFRLAEKGEILIVTGDDAALRPFGRSSSRSLKKIT